MVCNLKRQFWHQKDGGFRSGSFFNGQLSTKRDIKCCSQFDFYSIANSNLAGTDDDQVRGRKITSNSFPTWV